MTNNPSKRPEILAPCGSYDILKAAINAGSDACYIGGDRFSARAYAENIDTASILKSIDYAHQHEVKLYLTVNTLFKNNEIKELKSFLLPYYEGGVDAVIVQDLGVFSLIRKLFPDLNVHISTQMNVTSVHAAKALRALGATRIVAAREMSLDELKCLKENVDVELEVFVHGAMCYSYSGQCLMSSLAGGRSGNRGRCAQPCRKCYDSEYILSMKDMCSLFNLPKIIDAGIDSLKIEGRMKNEYYVASCVDAYRSLCDAYINKSYSGETALKYKRRLENIYNRGGFTDGYFFAPEEAAMISKEKPGNRGAFTGKIINVEPGRVTFAAETDIYKQDVLEIELARNNYIELTSPVDVPEGKLVTLNAPGTRNIKKGMSVYRTRCNRILEEVKANIINRNRQLEMKLCISARIGERLVLSGAYEGFGKKIEAGVSSEYIVEASENRPADKEALLKKLCQTNDTNWRLCDVSFDLDEGAFIPLSEIKRLRRELLEEMNICLTSRFRRHAPVKLDILHEKTIKKINKNPLLKISVMTMEQLRAAIGRVDIYGIYLSRALYTEAREEDIIALLKKKGVKIYITLPYVVKSDFDINVYLKDILCDGLYIRNIDGFFSVLADIGSDKLSMLEVVCGASCYVYNDFAADFIKGLLPGVVFEAPEELNLSELKELDFPIGELSIYGYQRVMLSSCCVQKNRYGCDKGNSVIKITDDRKNSFFARAYCCECVGLIYNGVPFCLMKDKGRAFFDAISPDYIKLNFTVEDGEDTRKVFEVYDGNGYFDKKTTTGHMFRGVE